MGKNSPPLVDCQQCVYLDVSLYFNGFLFLLLIYIILFLLSRY